jgi:hypothetical protein
MLTTEEIKLKLQFYLERSQTCPVLEERIEADRVSSAYRDVLYSFGHDPIVCQMIDNIIKRSRAGMEEYGTTLDANGLPPIEWLNHLQEELLDASLYIEKIKSIKS